MKPHFFATIDEVRDIFSKYAEEHHGESDNDAQFDRWLAAHDAEIRADEREKAAQRVRRAWADEPELACGRFQHVLVDTAIAAARGGEQE